jgi:hypothetical protein
LDVSALQLDTKEPLKKSLDEKRMAVINAIKIEIVDLSLMALVLSALLSNYRNYLQMLHYFMPIIYH